MKKIKNGAKKPPLSLLDKTIYTFLMLLGFALGLVVFWYFGDSLPTSIEFADDAVVASYNIAAIFCAIPMMIFVSCTVMALTVIGTENKQPIFGNKRFKPSALNPTIKTFPIFSKEFRENISNGTKRKIKKTVLILIILFVICSVVLSLGMYPRTVLDKNNNCTAYGVFNNTTHSCDITDAEKLVIGITKWQSSRAIYIKFVFADKTYKFSDGSFHEMTTEETLNYMLYLKSLFDDRYELTDIQRVDELIAYEEFSAAEAQLVYELFDYNAS